MGCVDCPEIVHFILSINPGVSVVCYCFSHPACLLISIIALLRSNRGKYISTVFLCFMVSHSISILLSKTAFHDTGENCMETIALHYNLYELCTRLVQNASSSNSLIYRNFHDICCEKLETISRLGTFSITPLLWAFRQALHQFFASSTSKAFYVTGLFNVSLNLKGHLKRLQHLQKWDSWKW